MLMDHLIPAELDEVMLKLTKNFDYIFASRYLSNAKSDDDTYCNY